MGYDVSLVERSLRAFDAVAGFWTLVDWHVVAGVMAYVMLTRSDDLILRVIEEFVPMSQPACHSRDHE